MKYFQEVKCIRLANNKLKITWDEPKNSLVKIYLENDDEELLIERIENSNEVIFTDPDNKRRLLFLLKSEGYNSELVGEKILPFVGVHHFRDIGGYRTKDGRRVKWSTFYRSDKLSDLTEEDIEYFKALGIKTILDLRSKGEVLSSPDPYIEGLKYINISGMSELDNNNGNFDMISIFNQNYLEHFDGKKFLMNGYRSAVFNNLAYKELIDCMENEERMPILFHCTAGKDRTGFASALILLILGVPEETVIKDYLLSNEYRKSKNEEIIKSIKMISNNPKHFELLNMMLEVRREYIEASFKEIRDKYENIDKYLEVEYGLSKTKRRELKKRYLY